MKHVFFALTAMTLSVTCMQRDPSNAAFLEKGPAGTAAQTSSGQVTNSKEDYTFAVEDPEKILKLLEGKVFAIEGDVVSAGEVSPEALSKTACIFMRWSEEAEGEPELKDRVFTAKAIFEQVTDPQGFPTRNLTIIFNHSKMGLGCWRGADVERPFLWEELQLSLNGIMKLERME